MHCINQHYEEKDLFKVPKKILRRKQIISCVYGVTNEVVLNVQRRINKHYEMRQETTGNFLLAMSRGLNYWNWEALRKTERGRQREKITDSGTIWLEKKEQMKRAIAFWIEITGETRSPKTAGMALDDDGKR